MIECPFVKFEWIWCFQVVEASEHCIGHFGYKRSTRKLYRIHLFSLFIYNFFLSLLLKSICEFTQIRIYSLAGGDMLSFFWDWAFMIGFSDILLWHLCWILKVGITSQALMVKHCSVWRQLYKNVLWYLKFLDIGEAMESVEVVLQAWQRAYEKL